MKNVFKLTWFSSVSEFCLMDFKTYPFSGLLRKVWLDSQAKCTSAVSPLCQGPSRLNRSSLRFWMAFFLLAFNHRHLLLYFLIMFCYFYLFKSGNSNTVHSKLVKDLLTDFWPLALWLWHVALDLLMKKWCLGRSHLTNVAKKCTSLYSPFLHCLL